MKIQLISDLHLDVCDYTATTTDADVIIIPGDVGSGFNTRSYKLFSSLLERSPEAHIIYVPGNHEFYGKDINTFRAELRRFCGPMAVNGYFDDGLDQRLHLLDNDEIVIGGVRFLGSTLWTDFELYGHSQKQVCMDIASQRLNDFYHIRINGDRFTPQDSVYLHNQAIKWLEMKLKHEPFDGETVVVTHHAPCFQSVVERYKSDLLSACFASNLEHLMGFSKLWLHGHMHDSLDYEVAGTRVLCNPRGYARNENSCENAKFKPAFVINIGDLVLSEAETMEVKNQATIEALRWLKKGYSTECEMEYYDINLLPESLADEYWEDHIGSTLLGIEGKSAVYTWDFEPWRDRYLVRLGAIRIETRSKP